MKRGNKSSNWLRGLFLWVVIFVIQSQVIAQSDSIPIKTQINATENKDTVILENNDIKTVTGYDPVRMKLAFDSSLLNRVPLNHIVFQPYVTVPQMIKGNLAGVYVQESSGEPGTELNMFVRGLTMPLLTKKELYEQQPAVFINGIPILRNNSFTYDLQKYDFSRIGTGTDLLSFLSADNIESIEVIKDPVRLANLGPLASRGAIWVVTKNATTRSLGFSVNSYFGYAPARRADVTNAAYENDFRKPFYEKYGTADRRLNYPAFLRDSSNADYYGPSNWTDEYYKATPFYSADASVTAGFNKASIRFFASALKNASGIDETGLNKYSASLNVNVSPYKWLSFSAMIDYAWMKRDRNRNVSDRLAEARYIPDLSNPLTPNKNLYSSYLGQFRSKSVIDDNVNQLLNSFLGVELNFDQFRYQSKLMLNYGEEYRDVFWPTALLEGNNFVSNYFASNQRFGISNQAFYRINLNGNKKNVIELQAGNNIYFDQTIVNYAYAYNGPNDFIKINVVNRDPNATDYLDPRGFIVYYFPSNMKSNIISFNGNALWDFDDKVSAQVLVRRDGSSNMRPDAKWFTGYGASINWNVKNTLLTESATLSSLNLIGSWSKLGKIFFDDRLTRGPQYRSDLGWGNESNLGSYLGIAGLTRPYRTGWVNYNMPWQYVDQLDLGINLGLMQDRLKFALNVYSKDDKNGVLPMSVPAEYGYSYVYKSGMTVNNKGLDLAVDAVISDANRNKIGWDFNANINLNKNTLKALPEGAGEVVLGTTKLEVGKPIDQFWLLQNNGIYNADSEVPVVNGNKLNYLGVPLQAGDPKWVDMNGDNVINDDDKVLQGNIYPKLSGGFGSLLSYNALSLNFQFYYALGNKLLNAYASRRLDFINNELANDISSVKEITFWEKKYDVTSFPQYNSWSNVNPYRQEQDLFLEDASYVKLRSVSLGFDFSKMHNLSVNQLLKRSMVYVTGTNLLTFTKFKGDDPELAGYNGIYTGIAMPLNRSFIIGVKLDF